jgi:hypothetical protein
VVAQHHHLGTSMPSGGVHTIKVVWRRFQVAQSTAGKGNGAKPGVHQENMRLKSQLAG